jgi:hypothetical protein
MQALQILALQLQFLLTVQVLQLPFMAMTCKLVVPPSLILVTFVTDSLLINSSIDQSLHTHDICVGEHWPG